MARRKPKAETVIGACGHTIVAWPRVTHNGGQYVLCDFCEDWIAIAVQLPLFELNNG